MNKIVLFFVTVLLGYHVAGGISDEMYYWKEVIYEDLPLADDTIIGKYPYHIPPNNNVNGINYHVQSGLVITTLARVRPGIPSSLNAFCASDYHQGTSPHIWGFPDYAKNTIKPSFYNQPSSRNLQSSHSAEYYNFYFGNKHQDDTSRKEINNYNGYNNFNDYNIVATHYPNVDNICNRLYLIDAGVLRYSASEIYSVQNQAILVYDLPPNGCQNRQFPLIRRVELPYLHLSNSVGFVYVTPDYQAKGTCDDVFLYIVDNLDNVVVVFDYKSGDFWSFSDRTMQPFYSQAYVPFKNVNYYIPAGISNVAVGWPDKNGDRNAYFAPVSSFAEIIVSTKVLKNSKLARYQDNPYDFRYIGYRGCGSKIYKQIFDESTGIIFFSEMSSYRVTCWNTQLPINPDTIGVFFESPVLDFVSDISIDSDGYLWLIGTQLPLIFETEIPLNLSDVNSIVFRIKISDGIKGTVCDSATYYKNKTNTFI